MKPEHLIVYCTCPDHATASRLAELVLAAKAAACVNIVGGIDSWFRWQGRVEHTEESLLLIKTTSARYPVLEHTLRDEHPYEVPEIIAAPITHGLTEYLHWLEE